MTVDPQLFEQYRYLLFSIAYRMLGSAMEAEDMVQEAFLRYQNAGDKHIQSPKAYLTTIVTRLCLDQLKAAKTQREEYVGTWLPEPIFTVQAASTEGQSMESESISMAFMVLLENLSPVERAVFLLREVFDYDYAAIAGIVNKSEANCRRYYHLAKGYLVERRPRFEPASGEQFNLVERFMHAVVEGDIDGLTSVLAEDITVYGDGGGKAPAARHPIVGREAVTRFLVGLNKLIPPDIHAELHNVNGALSFVFWYGGKLSLVMNLTMVGDRVTAIHNILNPDKLVYLNQSQPPDEGVEIPAS